MWSTRGWTFRICDREPGLKCCVFRCVTLATHGHLQGWTCSGVLAIVPTTLLVLRRANHSPHEGRKQWRGHESLRPSQTLSDAGRALILRGHNQEEEVCQVLIRNPWGQLCTFNLSTRETEAGISLTSLSFSSLANKVNSNNNYYLWSGYCMPVLFKCCAFHVKEDLQFPQLPYDRARGNRARRVQLSSAQVVELTNHRESMSLRHCWA